MKRHKLLFILLLAMNIEANDMNEAVVNSQALELVSPEVNPDSSVTFRYYAPDAKKVSIKSDCLLTKEDDSWFGGRMKTQKMLKDTSGVWSYTTHPLKPEVYQYRFIVDGNFCHDPLNKDSTYVLLHQESVVAVGGDNCIENLYVENPLITQGTLDTLDYFDDVQQVNRKVLVYVPTISNTQADSLPILYLFHGISGDERSWVEAGRLMQVVDNMIAEGKLSPIIIVMPDCNVMKKIAPKQRTNLLRNMFNYPALQLCDFEKAFPRLLNYVEAQYPVRKGKQYHAVAGLSSGAKQAANIVRDNPELFGTIGLFSPVLGKAQLPNNNADHYCVYVGSNDLFYKNGKRFAKQLISIGADCDLTQSTGAHTWSSWRHYLVDFLANYCQF